MTVREFAMVGCKVLGLYFILIALVGFGKGCFTLIASMASLTQMDGLDVLSGPFGCNTLWSMFSGLIPNCFKYYCVISVFNGFAKPKNNTNQVNLVLVVPDGIELVYLPPYTPELQPAERIWPLLRESVANRVLRRLMR